MKKISQKFVQKSRQLRKQGLTHREIAKLLDLGIGTVFHYTKGMSLSLEQKIKLKHISIYQKDIFPKFRLQVLLKDVI